MFSREFDLKSNKTYASKENVRKAVHKAGLSEVRHFIMQDDTGRFFPVFVGQEALQRGAHFHFTYVG